MWWSTIPSLQRLIEHIRHKNTKKPWKRQEKWKEIIHSLFTKKPFCRWNRSFWFYTVSKVLLQSGKMIPLFPKRRPSRHLLVRGMARLGDMVSEVSLHHELLAILYIDALALWFALNATTLEIVEISGGCGALCIRGQSYACGICSRKKISLVKITFL